MTDATEEQFWKTFRLDIVRQLFYCYIRDMCKSKNVGPFNITKNTARTINCN